MQSRQCGRRCVRWRTVAGRVTGLPVVMAMLTLGWAIAPIAAVAQTPAAPRTGQIEKLLTDGWEVAGYVTAWENRTLILFKHKDHSYLTQCSVLIDVTRTQRVVVACYELR